MTEPDEARLDDQQAAAVRYLVTHPEQVGRASGREPVREALLWLTRGRWPRQHGWPVVPRLGTPWQDTVSNERIGWRMCTANPRGHDTGYGDTRDEFVFEVDYQPCHQCRIGWVEQPHTLERRHPPRRPLTNFGTETGAEGDHVASATTFYRQSRVTIAHRGWIATRLRRWCPRARRV